ncbi:MAG: hypothetical protein IJC29_01655 [Clostridia bacterium]|nr:hypothetical protein [Clostridia bacterium]
MKELNTRAARICGTVGGLVLFAVGTLVASLVHQPRPWAWGLIAGAIAALLLFLPLWGHAKIEHVKYREALSRLPAKPHGMIYSRVLAQGVNRKRAMVFLTERDLVIYLWDRHPYMETCLHREDFSARPSAYAKECIEILFENDTGIVLVSGQADELLSKMRELGYAVADRPEENPED